jgi:Protein of unknown function (DUF732)
MNTLTTRVGSAAAMLLPAFCAILAFAPQAGADTDTFLHHMHRMGYSNRMSDDALVDNGNTVCELFDQGYSYGEVADEVYPNTTNLSYDDTYYFVGVAKASMCY